MIPLNLREIADIVGGDASGEALVTAPASVDSRTVASGGLFVAIVGERVDGHDFVDGALTAGAAATLSSRPVPGPHIVVNDVIDALGRLASHVLGRLQGDGGLTVIGVTGSQGKTSTKDLLAQVLSVLGPTIAPVGSFNNDLGVPLTALRADDSTRFLIIEMGARGRGHIARLCAITHPTIGVVLNVGDAHAAEFGSRADTAHAKGELPASLPDDGWAILNADDDIVSAMPTSAQILRFGERGDVRLSDLTACADGSTRFSLTISAETAPVTLPLLGIHQAYNAAAVAAVAHAVGLPLPDIAEALGRATVVSPFRMERIVRSDGLTIINDAYNANPESVAAALKTLAAVNSLGRRIAVVGEMLELGDISHASHLRVGELAVELGIDLVLAIGEGARPASIGAGQRGRYVDTVDEAISLLNDDVNPADVVLVKASRSIGLERVATGLADAARHTS